MTHEPRVLFVAWQCPEPESRAYYPVARLLQDSGSPTYELAYLRGAREAMKVGFLPFTLNPMTAVERSERLPAFLANRLMSKSRPDYLEHLRSLGLAQDAEPITVLGRSDGSRITDNLEVFAHPTFDPASRSWVYKAFCRGVRHVRSEEAVAALKVGDRLIIEPEPTNPFDTEAMLLLRNDSVKLGYVPRTLMEDLEAAQTVGMEPTAYVERLNPPPLPVQQRLLVRIQIPATPAFRPLSTDRYQPMSPEATVFEPGQFTSGCKPDSDLRQTLAK